MKKRIRELVNVDARQLGFMPGRGTADAMFVVGKMQEEYRDKKKNCVCVLWILRKHLIDLQERRWSDG